MPQLKEKQSKLVALKTRQTSGDLAAPCGWLPRYLAAGNGSRTSGPNWLGNKDSLNLVRAESGAEAPRLSG